VMEIDVPDAALPPELRPLLIGRCQCPKHPSEGADRAFVSWKRRTLWP
jgi:hypothetical protein